MKLLALGMSVTICGALACAPASGQAPPADLPIEPHLKTPAEFVLHPSPFEPEQLAPHFSLGYDDLWNEYRGAAIEHDWPEARRTLAGGPKRPGPILSLMARWLDHLFAPLPWSKKRNGCPHCSLPASSVDAIVPSSEATEDLGYAPEQSAVPANPADHQPTRPDLRADPGPPNHQLDSPSTGPVPRRLGPAFPPVVELAPEPVIPAEPPRALPRNRVPAPSQRLPKNQVPR